MVAMETSRRRYIYPESHDIDAIAQAVKADRSPSRAGLCWNARGLLMANYPLRGNSSYLQQRTSFIGAARIQ